MKSTKQQNVSLTVAAIVALAVIAWVSLRGTTQPSDEIAQNPKSADVMSPGPFTAAKARAA